jgi:hypothetical protein
MTPGTSCALLGPTAKATRSLEPTQNPPKIARESGREQQRGFPQSLSPELPNRPGVATKRAQ